MTNLIQSDGHKNLIGYVIERGEPSFKVSSRYDFIKVPEFRENLEKTTIFLRFFRPVSGFRAIASGRVVDSLRNIDKNLPLEISLLTMYH